MKKIRSFLVLVLALIALASQAQLKKANQYYDNYEYSKAIPLYKKAIKKNESVEALSKLASSYRVTKNYAQAETYYARLMKLQGVDPIDHFYYGMVLKNVGKIDEAKEHFKIYANAAPGDKKADISVRSCDDIKLWISRTQQFEVSPVEKLNTANAEFGPAFLKDRLVFVSERGKDMVNYDEYSWNDQPFLNVYSVGLKQSADAKPVLAGKAKAFSSRINSNYHDGPVCFNQEQNLMFVTRVSQDNKQTDKKFVNLPKLYISTLEGSKWSKLQPFAHNNDAYALAHPALSPDGKILYFASDMPGGQGGMDLYLSRREGDSWSAPVNLGADVNTAGDEVFPYVRKDGMLFFASDGHSGFGGLDIFAAENKGNGFYNNVKNPGSPLNSYTDDFSIVFSDDLKTGYFASDRSGGKGSDDIYSFVALNKVLKVAGKILLSNNINDPAKNAEVMLLTDDGKVITVTTTDASGFFKFDNLDPDKKYLVKLDETDPMFANKKKYYMADEKDNIVRVTVINEKGGKFVFENLPADPNAMPELGPGEDITIAGNLLFGESPSKPMANTKVSLVNDKGEVVQTATTNAFGAFVFTDLPPDQNFLVRVDESDTDMAPNTKIIITNKSGKEIQTTKSGAKGEFKFSFIAADKNVLNLMAVEDSELRFDLRGKLLTETKAPLTNSVINLVNDKGEVIQSTKTDNGGNFQFKNLPADKNMLFALDEKDAKLKGYSKLYLTDENGTIIKEFTKSNGSFKFTLLPTEQKKMGKMYVDDPWLKVLQLKNDAKRDSLTIVENIYYNYGESKILPEAQKALDKVINLMKLDPQLVIELSSHTDARSTNEFNMKLSQQRAKAAVDYMLNRGVAKDRISGKGYGESKILNKCVDGVECTEEEHAKNRRTEFKISRRQ